MHVLHYDLPILPQRTEAEKAKKVAGNVHDNNEYVIHKRNLKQALNHGLILRNIHKAIKFNQGEGLDHTSKWRKR